MSTLNRGTDDCEYADHRGLEIFYQDEGWIVGKSDSTTWIVSLTTWYIGSVTKCFVTRVGEV